MSLSITARLAAAYAVKEVIISSAQMETALAAQPGFMDMAPRDRAFARLIAATTFRRLGQIDAVLKQFLRRKPAPLAHAVLRTASAQILFLKTPAHAAVGESVTLLKGNHKTRAFAGMVNAVLRKVVEQGPKILATIPPTQNIPGWLRNSWETAYGKPALRRMAVELSKEPPLDIFISKNMADWTQKLEGDLVDAHTCRLEKASHIPSLAGFETGEWWVQDVAASQPVNMLGDITGLKVLDLCAAPGGKTLQLASKGAQVTAIDKSERRLDRLRENLDRTGLKADIVVADALEWATTTEQRFDVVLLDAPCSATGTYRRHPDVLYNKVPKTVSSLGHVQRKLLDAATELTASHGRLVYCSCSLQPEEGEGQAESFLSRHPDWKLATPTVIPLQKWDDDILKKTYFRSLPHFGREMGGMDGFFTVIFRPQ